MKKFWKSLDWIIPELELVRGIILFSLDSASLPHPKLRETALSLFDPPGKMIRSGMVISAARTVSPEWSGKKMRSVPGYTANDYKREIRKRSRDLTHIDQERLSDIILPGALPLRMYLLAAALEVLHTASLVHDDVLDNATLRRNCTAAQVRIGNRQAILLGDHLMTLAFQLVSEAAGLNSGRMISRVMGGLCRGEMLQNSMLFDLEYGRSQRLYRQRIAGKTATMISLSMYVGAREALLSDEDRKTGSDDPSRDPEVCRYIRRFGYNLGMAFQIIDDVLDLDVQAANGKEKGQDIREGILTLPIILELENGSLVDDDLQKLWKQTGLETGCYDGENGISPALHTFLNRPGIRQGIDGSMEIASAYSRRADDCLVQTHEQISLPVETLRTISSLLLKRRY